MAFLDKLSEIAKTASDKAGIAVEITRINGKISAEKAKVNNLKALIGDYFIAQYESGTSFPAEVTDLFEQVKASNLVILDLQAEIARIKDDRSEPKSAFAAEASAAVCPSCGAQVGPGKKFCPECGNKLETPPATKACTACGAQIPAGVKFCPECGTPT